MSKFTGRSRYAVNFTRLSHIYAYRSTEIGIKISRFCVIWQRRVQREGERLTPRHEVTHDPPRHELPLDPFPGKQGVDTPGRVQPTKGLSIGTNLACSRQSGVFTSRVEAGEQVCGKECSCPQHLEQENE